MNLDELMRLRLYVKSNKNKVVSKESLLIVLDSHIRLSMSLDDRLVIRDKKTPQRANMEAYERVEQVRLPPNREEVRKAYNA